MRFDERQVQAPWGVTLLGNEVHATVDRISRFGKFIRQAGGQMGISEQPSAGQLAFVIDACIGPVVPRVGPIETFGAQVLVVGQIMGRLGIRVDAIVAPIFFKPAGGDEFPRPFGSRQAQPVHPGHIGFVVCFADHGHAHARGSQIVTQGSLTHGQRHKIPCGAM